MLITWFFMTYDIDFLIEKSSGFDVYSGEMHLNPGGSEYYMSGSVTNQHTGDVGELDLKYNNITVDNNSVKCNIDIALQCYHSSDKMYESAFFNKDFKISNLDKGNVMLIDDDYSLPKKLPEEVKVETKQNHVIMLVRSSEMYA
ncbi:hypothetical protein IMW64_04810 [Ehrlichia ruminantium]|nr:hypothetical protein FDZ59_04895 [Ehrlichia ruminantium]UOD97870.1 hypothetical protein IMW64_04810 [Ehrlichia ruminantium]